jgi:hypothetical protein
MLRLRSLVTLVRSATQAQLWDGAAEMLVMNDFVNQRLKDLQEKGFTILDIKSFGTSVVTMKTGSITYDINEGGRVKDKALYEGLVVGIIYDDNL